MNTTPDTTTDQAEPRGSATYCPEDNKLRLYVGRVPRDEYLKLRAEGWTALHKQRETGGGDFAATWTPSRRDTALAYSGGYIGDEDQGPAERAADRAERFSGYRDKREGEAIGLRKSEITAARGVLTDRVQAIANATLGRNITLRELRLIPYMQYVMVNERRLDPSHVSQEERDILSTWRKQGHIEGGASGLSITKEFWTAICEILWVAYATYDNPEV